MPSTEPMPLLVLLEKCAKDSPDAPQLALMPPEVRRYDSTSEARTVGVTAEDWRHGAPVVEEALHDDRHVVLRPHVHQRLGFPPVRRRILQWPAKYLSLTCLELTLQVNDLRLSMNHQPFAGVCACSGEAGPAFSAMQLNFNWTTVVLETFSPGLAMYCDEAQLTSHAVQLTPVSYVQLGVPRADRGGCDGPSPLR